MSNPARKLGPDITVLHDSSETISRDAAEVMPQRSTAGEAAETAASVGPTKSEIAALAFQLWLDNGCPDGTEQEDWSRAEAMLKTAFAAAYESLSRRPSTPAWDTGAEYEILAELQWEGHWEAWEREWGVRWVCDSGLADVQPRIEPAETAARELRSMSAHA